MLAPKKKRRRKHRTVAWRVSCPRCKANHDFRILPVKTVADRALWLLGLHPVLCVRCLQPFHMWPFLIRPDQRRRVKTASSA